MVILGCGYLGTALAERALKAGVGVCALTHNPHKAAELEAMGLSRVVEAELDSTRWHDALPAHAEHVVVCVGAASPEIEGYRRSYLEGMYSVLEWFQGANLLFTSSTRVYPDTGGGWVNENTPADRRDDRASILLETERWVLESGTSPAGEGVGWRNVVLRLGGIYGPDRQRMLERAYFGELSLDEHRVINLIHRDDAVKAIWMALNWKEMPGGIYNTVDDHPARLSDIGRWALSQRGGAGTPRENPRPAPAGAPGLGRRPKDRRISNQRLRAACGWTPNYPSFREGFASLLDPPRLRTERGVA